MKTAALWIGASLVLLVAAVVVVGWFLPVTHIATADASIDAPPERVFELVSDVERYPSWWSDISRIEMLPPVDGRSRFRQHSSDGTIVMEVVEATPPSRFVTRIADADQPFGGTWTWEISREGAGAHVTITERGEIYNPIFRFMARFVLGYTSTMARHLAALTAAAGAP